MGKSLKKLNGSKKHWSCLLTGIQYDNTALQGDTIDRLTAVYTILTVKSVDAEFGNVEKRLRQSTGESMRRNTHEPPFSASDHPSIRWTAASGHRLWPRQTRECPEVSRHGGCTQLVRWLKAELGQLSAVNHRVIHRESTTELSAEV